MRHISDKEWQDYLTQRLSAQEKTQLEAHLYQCDQCLTQYLMHLDASAESMPVPEEEPKLVDTVMERLGTVFPAPELERMEEQHHRSRQTFFHYALAAAVTLILLSTGVFEHLVTTLGEATNQRPVGGITSMDHSTSWSTEMMEQVGTWFDQINEELKEGR